MANHSVRLPMRNRTGPQRPKINGDENATSRHVRQSSSVAIQGVSRLPHAAVAAAKTGPQRPALSEVTTTAVNRKENVNKFNGNGKEKEVAEVGTKRTRSSAAVVAGPQRVPLNSTRAGPVAPTVTSVHTRSSSIRVQRPHVPARVAHRVPVPVPQEYLPPMATEDLDGEDDDMDIEEQQIVVQSSSADQMNSLDAEQEVNMEAAGYDEDLELEVGDFVAKSQRVWPEVNTERAERYRREVDEIRESFDDPVDEYDMTMVSEYSEEIFEYMTELETLVDWLLQVHLRYHMLPETLWTAVNIVDRFLSKRVVYILKLQLVGVIAMFIAAKYEEILAPSVDEFVYMTENGYTKEEILKGERIVLQTLDFKISHYCSPYSWMRKISKADDYDIQTRTLSKFLTEVTLLDHRFLRVKPSLVAAIGMYTARRMLGGDWNDAFVFYSGFTEEHLFPGHQLLIDKLTEAGFTKQHVCQKYANKKFLKASLYAIEWARSHIEDDLPREMNVEA